MYRWLVFLHIVGAFAFLMAHGVSAAVMFALRRERSVDRIRSLLELSRGSLGIMLAGLLMILATGIANGFIGHWWKAGWIWTSLGLFVAIYGLMSVFGSGLYNRLRLGLGLPSSYSSKPAGGQELDAAQIDAILSRSQPVLLTLIGFGGLVIITGLMIFKPF
jgi:small-conductance mechanosensitive channel